MKKEDGLLGVAASVGCLVILMELVAFGLVIVGLYLGVQWLWSNT